MYECAAVNSASSISFMFLFHINYDVSYVCFEIVSFSISSRQTLYCICSVMNLPVISLLLSLLLLLNCVKVDVISYK